MGEANQDVPITIPESRETQRKRTTIRLPPLRSSSVLLLHDHVQFVPAVGHDVSIVRLEGQFLPVFWVVDIEKRQYLLVDGNTYLRS